MKSGIKQVLCFSGEYVTVELAKRSLDRVTKLVVDLKAGDSAWNPACTGCYIYGPGTVAYELFPDGGIVATATLRGQG